MYAARVQETTTGTGSGTLALAGAVTNFQSFQAAFGTGTTATFTYFIIDSANNAWETGSGHLTGSGPYTLNRDTVKAGTNGPGVAVTFAAGTKTVFCDWSGSTITDTYTASATWTKRAGALVVSAFLVGQGGGGGSGGQAATSVVRNGGSAGGGGGTSYGSWPASIIGSTEAVTCSSTSNGGAGMATTSHVGTAGTDGSDSVFGNWLRAGGGKHGLAGTITAAASAGGAAGTGNMGNGGAGGGVSTAAVASAGSQGTGMGAGGGGAGGGLTSGNATTAGAAGGAGAIFHGSTLTGGAAGTGSTSSTSGTACSTGEACGGPGGGGGHGNATTTGARSGAAGGIYGGGGGGGAGTLNGTTSGAGADGGSGIVVVITGF